MIYLSSMHDKESVTSINMVIDQDGERRAGHSCQHQEGEKELDHSLMIKIVEHRWLH